MFIRPKVKQNFYGAEDEERVEMKWMTYHIYELGKLKFDAHCERIRGVDDRPDQLVVVGEQVVVQTLGVRVAERAFKIIRNNEIFRKL